MIRLERVRARLGLFCRVAAETGSYDDAMWAVLQEEQRHLREERRGERAFCPKAQAVVNATCDACNVRLVDFLSSSRAPALVAARYVAMRALRDLGYSLPVIGLHVHRDHSTVLHGLDAVSGRDDLLEVAAFVRRLATQQGEQS